MRVVSTHGDVAQIGGGDGKNYILNAAPEETDLPDELAKQLIAAGEADPVGGDETEDAPAPAPEEAPSSLRRPKARPR